MAKRAHYLGVDGFRHGWVAVCVDDSGVVGSGCYEDFGALMKAHADAAVIGVDIPIGLRDDGGRLAEGAARAFLRGRASSVFNAPARPVLQATTYQEAAAISVRASGKSMSRQSFGILAKIREVDAFAGNPRVYEVHPEVSFQLMAGGPLAHSKKTWGGLQARLSLLRKHGVGLRKSLGAADAVGIDDVVDAGAAA